MHVAFSKLFLCLCVLATTGQVVSASAGDQSSAFRNCLNSCAQPCPDKNAPSASLTWTCLDLCSYQCAQTVSDAREFSGLPAQQFYGKWPLLRLFFLQEPASVLFSILNLLPHARWFSYWFQLSQNRVPKKPQLNVYAWLCAISAGISVNAWVWSAIFHARDRWWTERLDYASAEFLIGWQLYASLLRVLFSFNIHSRISKLAVAGCVLCIWISGACAAGIFSSRIDYGMNTIFGTSLAVLHSIVWLVWAFIASSQGHPAPFKPVLLVLWLFSAAGFELLELPNGTLFRIIDTHSLWHLATVPVINQWYSFLVQDLEWLSASTQKNH